MNEFETQVLSLLQSMDNRMTGLEGKVTGLEDRMTGLEDRMTGLEDRMTGLEDRMTGLESEFKSFKAETNHNFEVVFHELEITRESANDTGMKLEKLINELKEEEIISKESYHNIMSNV